MPSRAGFAWPLLILVLGCPSGDPSGGADGAVPADASEAPPDLRPAARDGGGTTHEVSVRLMGEGAGRVDGGSIHCTATGGPACAAVVPDGAVLTLQASPEDGSGVTGWSLPGCGHGDTTCEVVVREDLSVEVTFAITPYALDLQTGAGVVEVLPQGIRCAGECTLAFEDGQEVTLVARPGWRLAFEGWEGACDGASGEVCALTMDASHQARALFDPLPDAPRVLLSDTDRAPDVRLRDDRLAVDFYEDDGVRSNRAIAPGSGAFYFEAHRLIPETGIYGFGVATASEPLQDVFVGDGAQSFGVEAGVAVNYAGGWVRNVSAENERNGFVVDYRSTTPTVYVIGISNDEGVPPAPAVLHAQPMRAVSSPLYIFLAGRKREAGFEVEINPGNDTTNFPFHYDVRRILREAGMHVLADEVVLGWGASVARSPDVPPVVTTSPGGEVRSGDRITLTGDAFDIEDGDLTPQLRWEVLSSPHYAARLRGSGSSFAFTPTAVGVHAVRAFVRDSAGQESSTIIELEVPGPVRRMDEVRLERDARTGDGIVLDPAGLRARWTAEGKMGIRANQPNYGRFWYFEIIRLGAVRNQGGGLVTGDGNLNPYSWVDIPGSCSINNYGGIWRDLMWQFPFPAAPASYTHYGFAVDFRGMHPVVYVILGDAVVEELALEDVWIEVYPMIYGNPSTTPPGSYDEAINFGAAPFEYDPARALTAYGIDGSQLEVGWGDANLP